MNIKKHVSNKISFVVAIVVVSVMALLFFIMNYNSTRILQDKSIRDMKVIAKDRASIVETYIEDCIDYLNGYYKASETRELLKDPDNPEKKQAAMDYTRLYCEGYSNIEGLYVAKWDTYVLAHINPDSIDKTFRDKEAAKELENMIKEHKMAFCTGIVQAPVTKKMVIPVYAPVYDFDGKAIGFTGAAFYSDMLAKKLTDLLEKGDDKCGYSLINADSKLYIFDDDSSLVGNPCKDPDLLYSLSHIGDGLSEDKTFSYEANDRIYCCYYMAKRNWIFIIKDSKENIFGVVKTVRTRMLIIFSIITFLMVLICRIVVERNMIPVKAINKAIERLKSNDFQSDPKIDLYCKREDEFGTIANAVKDLHIVLESQYELFQEVFEAQSVGTIVLSAEEENVILINHMAMNLFRLDKDFKEGLKITDIRQKFSEDENSHIKEQLDTIRDKNGEVVFEERIDQNDNSKITLLNHAKSVSLANGEKVIIISLTDITEQKNLENNLMILSETDFLTSICNRRSGEFRIEENIQKEEYGMFCLFDVDHFKYVNDTFGHAAGDALLIAIAKTMKKTFRTSDVLIRLGGDEFVIFALGISDPALGETVIKRFLNNISSMEVPELKGHKISISLGAVITTEYSDFSSMYAKADSLMYDCKKKDGNYYMFYNS
ncbi:MAG: diguanylate cyclase [Lachnospiraceae bacterium]|nr:diguanylate cyclase [Lachnospiraceae bacterium]